MIVYPAEIKAIMHYGQLTSALIMQPFSLNTKRDEFCGMIKILLNVSSVPVKTPAPTPACLFCATQTFLARKILW